MAEHIDGRHLTALTVSFALLLVRWKKGWENFIDFVRLRSRRNKAAATFLNYLCGQSPAAFLASAEALGVLRLELPRSMVRNAPPESLGQFVGTLFHSLGLDTLAVDELRGSFFVREIVVMMANKGEGYLGHFLPAYESKVLPPAHCLRQSIADELRLQHDQKVAEAAARKKKRMTKRGARALGLGLQTGEI